MFDNSFVCLQYMVYFLFLLIDRYHSGKARTCQETKLFPHKNLPHFPLLYHTKRYRVSKGLTRPWELVINP
jgi:hypothetical protein